MARIILQIKVYDGTKSREDIKRYWIGKTEEVAFSVNANTTVIVDGVQTNVKETMDHALKVVGTYMASKDLKRIQENQDGYASRQTYKRYYQNRSNSQYRK